MLETENLVLRGHRQSELNDCIAMWADPKVVEHISGIPSTPEQTWSRFLRYAGLWHHLGFGYWVIADKSDDRFLGEAGFADFHRDTTPSIKSRPEVGWALASQWHRQGIATEAVSAILRWADRHLNATHSSAIINPTNLASIHLAKKLGFANEVMGSYGGNDLVFLERARWAGSKARAT